MRIFKDLKKVITNRQIIPPVIERKDQLEKSDRGIIISLMQFPQMHNFLLTACVDIHTDLNISGFLQAMKLIYF